MSRFFSSVSRAAKDIKWELNGTTKHVQKHLAKIQTALDGLPELAEVVEKGRVNGDPHSTTRADGTVDPIHISGVLGRGNLRRSKRATSFHWYPETGDLTFSNPKYPPIRIDQSGTTAESFSAQDWVWDEGAQKYRYWDGSQWVWQE